MTQFKNFLIIGLILYGFIITSIDTYTNKVLEEFINDYNICLKWPSDHEINPKNNMYPPTLNWNEKFVNWYFRIRL